MLCYSSSDGCKVICRNKGEDLEEQSLRLTKTVLETLNISLCRTSVDRIRS